MASNPGTSFEWLKSGDAVFASGLASMESAERSVRLEVYHFSDSALGRRVLELLIAACKRGVAVRVLVDAIGSFDLPDSFWSPLREAGGEMRWFNPLSLRRFAVRDHRKMLVCDDRVAFIGGFNIAPQYEGDGVTRGWRDLALRIEGDLALRLAASFDDLFNRADYRHARLLRFRGLASKQHQEGENWRLLLSGPGRGRNPLMRHLLNDCRHARSIHIMVPYFLPTVRLRRAIARSAHRGGHVQLLLPGVSDVLLSRLAGRSLYRRLLRAGVEIFEYQPQVLHAKLFIVDGVVYAGSSNLDPRSLRINYELMVRLTDAGLRTEARQIFEESLAHSQRIELKSWIASRSRWDRLQERWAHFALSRLDPLVASWQYRRLKG